MLKVIIDYECENKYGCTRRDFIIADIPTNENGDISANDIYKKLREYGVYKKYLLELEVRPYNKLIKFQPLDLI